MPTATKFAWIFESTAEDVSGLSSWTTLGGFNKDSTGSPTQAQIDSSMINAAKLYFNFYQLDGTSGGAGISLNVDGHARYEPQSRVKIDWLYKFSTGISFDVTTIARFYDGATTNEANFVGYGLRVTPASKRLQFTVGDSNTFTNSTVSLSSASSNTDVDTGGFQRRLDYVQFSGMHFVCTCIASATSYLSSYTVNPATLSAAALDGDYYDPSDASIDSFTFFTY